MKRAFVPTALHAELAEYTDLVRVIRTTRTLDLTAHLVHHAEQRTGAEVDTWTSWPLIDCPVPEWSLEDEIRYLGETVARKQTQAAYTADDLSEEFLSDSDLDSDSEAISCSKRLVLHTGALLVRILNLLADQRPSAPGSMQNRLWQMNWEDVISLLAVSGTVEPSVIARAEKRLQRIYGPSTTKTLERLESATSVKARCALFATVAEEQLFASPVLSRARRSDGKVPQSHKNRVKSRTVIDTDTDSDAQQTHYKDLPPSLHSISPISHPPVHVTQYL